MSEAPVNVKVTIKVRPLLKREKDAKQEIQWNVYDNFIQHNDNQEKFHFDGIYDERASTHEVFDAVVRPIVGASLNGINGTVFAYGQTSSGKTYTMLGDDSQPGIMILAVREIFKQIEVAVNREFLLSVGYIEIYNEKVKDLLDPTVEIKIQDAKNGDINVNHTRKIVNSEAAVLNVMQDGNRERKTGDTKMNERSSRSHTIFRIILESREIGSGDEVDGVVQISYLNLVDLAGSEKANQTGATGSRLIEGGFINKSLLSLGCVIQKLSENESDQYINYRDSKLTRILQASLGGNTMTAFICTISPAVIEETYSTLNFAMRAKTVKNQPVVNEFVSDSVMLKKLQKEIVRLQRELDKRNSNDVDRADLENKIKTTSEQIITSSRSHKDPLRRRTWCPSVARSPLPNEMLPPPEKPNIFEENRSKIRRGKSLAPDEIFIPSSDASFGEHSNSLPDIKTPKKFIPKRWPFDSPIATDWKGRVNQLQDELDELQHFTKLEKHIRPSLADDQENVALKEELKSTYQELMKYKEEHIELLQYRAGLYDIKEDVETNEQVEEVNARLIELNQTLTELNIERDQLQRDKLIAERSVKELTKSKELLQMQTSSLEYEYELYKNRAKVREQELLQFLDDPGPRNEHLSEQNILLETQLKDSENKNWNLDKENKRLEAVNKELIEKLNRFSSEVTEIRNSDKEINELKNQIATLELNSNLCADLKNQIQCEVNAKEKIQTEFDELSNQLMDIVQENDQTKKMLEELELCYDRLNSEYNNHKNTSSKSMDDVNQLNHSLKSQLAKCQEEVTHFTNENNFLTSELDKRNASISLLTAELASLRKTIEEETNNSSQLLEEIRNVALELDDQSEALLLTNQNTKTDIRLILNNLKDKFLTLKAECSKLEVASTSEHRRMDERKELNETRDKLVILSDKLCSLEPLKVKNDILETEIKETKANMVKLQAECDEAKNQIDCLQEDLESMTLKNKVNERDKISYQQQVIDTKEKLKCQTNAEDHLKSEFQYESKRLKTSVEALTIVIRELIKSSDHKQEQISLKQVNDDLNLHITEQQDRINALNKVQTNLEREIEILKASNRESMEELNISQNQIRTYENNDLNTIKNDLFEMNHAIDELQVVFGNVDSLQNNNQCSLNNIKQIFLNNSYSMENQEYGQIFLKYLETCVDRIEAQFISDRSDRSITFEGIVQLIKNLESVKNSLDATLLLLRKTIVGSDHEAVGNCSETNINLPISTSSECTERNLRNEIENNVSRLWESKNYVLEKDLRQTKAKLSRERANVKQLQPKIHSLIVEKDSLNIKNNCLSTGNNNLELKLNNMTTKYNELQNNFDSMKIERDELVATIDQLKTRINELTVKNDRLNVQITVLKEQETIHIETEKNLNCKLNKLTVKKDRLQTHQTAVNEEKHIIEKELQTKLNELMLEKVRVAQQLEQANETNNNIQLKICELKLDNDQLKQHLSEMKDTNKNLSMVQEAFQSKLTDLIAENDSLKTNINKLNEEKNDLYTVVENNRVVIRETEDECNSMRMFLSNIQKVHDENDLLKSDKKELMENNENLKALHSAMSTEFQQLFIDLQKKDSELHKIAKEMKINENILRENQDQKISFENTILVLREEIKILTADRDDALKKTTTLDEINKQSQYNVELMKQKFTALEGSLISLCETNQSLQLENKTTKENCNKMEQDLQRLSSEKHNLLSEIQISQQDYRLQENMYSDLQSKFTVFKNNAGEFQSKIAEKNESFTSKIKSLEDEINKLHKEREDHLCTQNNLNKIIDALKEEQNELNAKLKELHSQLENKNEKHSNLMAQCKFEEKKCEKIKQYESQLISTIANLKEQILEQDKQIKVQHDDLRAEIQRLSESKDELKNTNTVLQDKLTEISIILENTQSKQHEILQKRNKEVEDLTVKNQQLCQISDELEEKLKQNKQVTKQRDQRTIDEIDLLKRNNQKLNEELQSIQRSHGMETSQLKNEIRNLIQKNEQLQERVQELQEKCRTENSFNEKEAKIKDLETKLQQVRNEKEELRRSMDKNRKSRRNSTYDVSRQITTDGGICYSRDFAIQTVPNDANCRCEDMDKRIKELTKDCIIKKCQLESLKIEIESNPLRSENTELKKRLNQADKDSFKLRREIGNLNSKLQHSFAVQDCMSCLTLKNKHASTKETQTYCIMDCTSNSSGIVTEVDNLKLKDNLQKLQIKYQSMKKLCQMRVDENKMLQMKMKSNVTPPETTISKTGIDTKDGGSHHHNHDKLNNIRKCVKDTEGKENVPNNLLLKSSHFTEESNSHELKLPNSEWKTTGQSSECIKLNEEDRLKNIIDEMEEELRISNERNEKLKKFCVSQKKHIQYLEDEIKVKLPSKTIDK